jgi:hypothetical protein
MKSKHEITAVIPDFVLTPSKEKIQIGDIISYIDLKSKKREAKVIDFRPFRVKGETKIYWNLDLSNDEIINPRHVDNCVSVN